MTAFSVPVTQELYEALVGVVFADEYVDRKVARLRALRLIERVEDDGLVERVPVRPSQVAPVVRQKRGKKK